MRHHNMFLWLLTLAFLIVFADHVCSHGNILTNESPIHNVDNNIHSDQYTTPTSVKLSSTIDFAEPEDEVEREKLDVDKVKEIGEKESEVHSETGSNEPILVKKLHVPDEPVFETGHSDQSEEMERGSEDRVEKLNNIMVQSQHENQTESNDKPQQDLPVIDDIDPTKSDIPDIIKESSDINKLPTVEVPSTIEQSSNVEIHSIIEQSNDAQILSHTEQSIEVPHNTEQSEVSNTEEHIEVSNTEQPIEVSNTEQSEVSSTEQSEVSNIEQSEVSNTEQSEVSNTEQSEVPNMEQPIEVSNTEQSEVSNTEQSEVPNMEQPIEVSNMEQSEVSNTEQPIEVSNTEQPIEVSNTEQPIEISNTEQPIEVSNTKQTIEVSNTEQLPVNTVKLDNTGKLDDDNKQLNNTEMPHLDDNNNNIIVNKSLTPVVEEKSTNTEDENITITEEEIDDIVTFEEFKSRKSQETASTKQQPPQVNIPLVRKESNNYASSECGAKVVATNNEARNPGAILIENKDVYMLNPCSANIWFVIELCELVSVSKFEIGCFELFSSIPETFAVYTSESYPATKWESLGSFHMRNERGIQNFPLADTVYAKYIKIVMLQHFGSEHYCPVSMIRVYGVTMMEEYEYTESQREQGQGSVTGDSETNQEEKTIKDDKDTDIAQKNGNPIFAATDAIFSVIGKAMHGLMGSEGKEFEDSDPHYPVQYTSIEDKEDKLRESVPVVQSSYESTDKFSQTSGVFFPETSINRVSPQPSKEHLESTSNTPTLSISNVASSLGPTESNLTESTLISFSLISPTQSDSETSITTQMTTHIIDTISPGSTGGQDLINTVSPNMETKSFYNEEMTDEVLHITQTPQYQIPSIIVPDQTPNTLVSANNNIPVPTAVLHSSEEIPIIHKDSLSIKEEKTDDSTLAVKPTSYLSHQLNMTHQSIDESKLYQEVQGKNETSDTSSLLTHNNISGNQTLSVGNQTNMTSLPSEEGGWVNGGTNGASGSPREKSVFVRLSNRINNLEMNMSLFGSYLDQISSSLKRNKNRTDDMQKSLERRIASLNSTVLSLKLQTHLNESILANLTTSLDELILLVSTLNEDSNGLLEVWLLTRQTKTSLQQSLENIENELRTLKKELTRAEPIHSTHPYKSLFISGCNGDARKSFSLDKDDGEGIVTTLSSTQSLSSTSFESLSQPLGGYSDSDNTHIDQWHKVDHSKRKKKSISAKQNKQNSL